MEVFLDDKDYQIANDSHYPRQLEVAQESAIASNELYQGHDDDDRIQNKRGNRNYRSEDIVFAGRGVARGVDRGVARELSAHLQHSSK